MKRKKFYFLIAATVVVSAMFSFFGNNLSSGKSGDLFKTNLDVLAAIEHSGFACVEGKIEHNTENLITQQYVYAYCAQDGYINIFGFMISGNYQASGYYYVKYDRWTCKYKTQDCCDGEFPPINVVSP